MYISLSVSCNLLIQTLVPSRLIQFFNNFSDIVRLIKLNENFARSLPITATNIEENVVKKFNVKVRNVCSYFICT